jgi:hypothetical protein
MEYFNGKTWNEITREERVFCAELYFKLRENIKPFLEKYQIDSQNKYEIGYEVCFYRDILKEYELDNPFPPKRTFDLALFSENEIYIFEAKCQQSFKNSDLGTYKKDKNLIEKLFKKIKEEKRLELNIPKIYLWAIISENYKPNKKTQEIFDKIISWEDIVDIYHCEIFNRANKIYKK